MSREVAQNDPRSALLLHNSGQWSGRFIRLNDHGLEQERFSTSLSVQENSGIIETCLTYCNSGQQRSMNFTTPPHTMQVTTNGCWSLGPSSITPFHWVAAVCVVLNGQRRRVIVRHGASGLDQVVYVRETLDQQQNSEPDQPRQCAIDPAGDFSIWQPEPGVQLLLDGRDRQTGDATACGMRWVQPDQSTAQIVRRYDTRGQLEELDPGEPKGLSDAFRVHTPI